MQEAKNGNRNRFKNKLIGNYCKNQRTKLQIGAHEQFLLIYLCC